MFSLFSVAEYSIAEHQAPYYSKLNILSYEHFKKGQFSDAYKTALLAKKEAISKGSQKDLARSLSNIASVNFMLGKTEIALKIYLESYKISKNIEDLIGLESTLNNLSGVYLRLENYEEALRYIEKLPVLNDIDRPNYQKTVAYNALIGLYSLTNQLELANYYSSLSIELYKTYRDDFSKFFFLNSYASLLSQENKRPQALKTYKDAEIIAITNKFDGLQVSALKNQGLKYFEMGHLDNAESVIEIATQMALILGMKEQLLQLYTLSKNIFLKQKKYEAASVLYEKIDVLRNTISGDSIKQLAEITKIDRLVEETQAKLNQSQKDKKILALQLERQSKNQLIWLICIISFVIIVFFFYYRRNSKREMLRQRKVNKQLKELDRVKDRILKNTSHELRTPLNGIVGLSEVILADNENKIDKATLDMVRLIKSSGEQLSLIINDILEMSKSRSGAITIINAEFSLTDLVSDVIKVCEPLAIEKSIEIKFLQSDTRKKITLDKTRLQQILFNIIGNAVKFTDKGQISISFICKNTELALEINDTGIGIPIEKIDRIMEGFEQVDSNDTRSKQGSGLGLAISRNICIALGGQLNIQSNLGKGTTVTISLPIYNNKKDSENAQH
ncbi:MAG: hypothetical protein COA86_17765 [Kangiella sp.]|nr:MAG: hypothetical protein COA86_17765 [Kangiella sp.]